MTVYLIVCVILAVILGGAYYAYRIAFYSPMKDREKIPEIKDEKYEVHKNAIRALYRELQRKPCEFVTVLSRDGLTLSGRYYHIKDGAPVAIGFHGYRSCWLIDFCGGADIAFQMEQNVLLIDERAHGKSQGRSITFGIKERQDLLCWTDYVLTRFGSDTKILLYGISMGAATVLMASGLELPENVKGIIADCPYSSPLDIILEVGKQTGYPPKLIRPFVILGAKIFGGFDVKETSAEEAVRHSKTPILIIHGADDNFVPAKMSEVISNANPEMVQRHTIPGADHALSYMVDTPRYRKLVTEFVERVL